jgi:hypothetical protein
MIFTAEHREHLDMCGYVVIEDVVSRSTCDLAVNEFKDYLETVNPKFKWEDPSTWTKNRPMHTRGLIQHYNVGFQAHAVRIRMATKQVFEELWGTKNLWTSFDGTSWSFKPKVHGFKSLKDWETKTWKKDAIHIDQTTAGLSSIQGGVALLDQEEDGHVFLCVPGSHQYHDEIMKGNFCQGDWLIMDQEHKALLKSKGLKMKRVPLKAGSMVLWDSRLCHSSSGYCKTSAVDGMRLQVFVCMKPTPKNGPFKEANMERRKWAYENRVVSHHTVTPERLTKKRCKKIVAEVLPLFSKKPRVYGAPNLDFTIPASVKMTEEEKKLHGLSS